MKHLVIGLVPNISTVTMSTWQTLNSWCATQTVILAIQVKTFSFLPLPLPDCTYVHLSQDSPEITNTTDRLKRLVMARQYQRQWLLPAIRNIGFSSVVVVDLDVVKLPDVKRFFNAQKLLQNWHIICANGYEWLHGKKQTYDTFALVLRNGVWMYEHLGLKQKLLFSKISQNDIFPVRFCFGGMAIYNSSVWQDTRCSYEKPPRIYIKKNKFCEHLAFQQCLKKFYNLKVTIDSQLFVERAWDPK